MKKLTLLVFFFSQFTHSLSAKTPTLQELQRVIFDLYKTKYEILMSYDFKPRDVLISAYKSYFDPKIANEKVDELRAFAAIHLKNLKRPFLQRYTLQVTIKDESILETDEGFTFQAEIYYSFMTNDFDKILGRYRRIEDSELVTFKLSNTNHLTIEKDDDTFVSRQSDAD
jgi:hypothetical protein